MKILITGASGFVGRAAVTGWQREGHQITAVSRHKRPSTAGITWITWDELDAALPKQEAVVHLAGENVFGGFWTESAKKRILESRVSSTRRLASRLKADPGAVRVFLSASAVGIYGDCGDSIVHETAQPGQGFLADVCKAWEAEAQVASGSVLVSIPRIGVVLEREGGALAKMIPQFQLFAGGAAGGSQFVAWIHRSDLLLAFLFAIERPISGPWNATAPHPVSMDALAEALGRALHRPSFFRMPAGVLRLVLGEASSAILASLRVVPSRLLAEGFNFRFTTVDEAVHAAIRRPTVY